MAEEYNQKSHEGTNTTTPVEVETKDRGVFDFLGGKKEEEKKPAHDGGYVKEEVIASEFEEKVAVSDKPKEEQGEEKKHHSLLEKLRRSDSSSSSSSEEEDEAKREEKKKKKKEKKEEDTSVPVEKCEVEGLVPTPAPEEKKGFLEKMKEKLPGQHKKPEEQVAAPPPPVEEYHEASPAEVTPPASQDGEAKEKKGIFDKIKEKLPGYHPKAEEEKEKEKC